MAIEPIKLRVLAQQKEEENEQFRRFLKVYCNLEPDEIDERTFELTRRVWAGIDCKSCANCCRELQPTFDDADVDRVAGRLGMDRQTFIATYLETTESGSDKPWHTRTTPCPFLKDNLCSIYEDRPSDCSGYPYLYAPNLVGRMWGMIDRTFTCPIVYEVMEALKRSVGFRPRRRR
jgi:Fe-S-cluster containining protein